MAEILTSSGAIIAGEPKVGSSVKLKGQAYSPVMTLLSIQRGKVPNTNQLITVAQCGRFTSGSPEMLGLTCEIAALEVCE